MGVVDVVDMDLVDAVEDVAEIGFAVDPDPFHGGHEAGDDALLGAGVRVRLAGARVEIQGAQMGQQGLVDEDEQSSIAGGEEFTAFPAAGLAFGCARMVEAIRPGRGPVLPAVGRAQGGGEVGAECVGLFLVTALLGVEDAQKEDPGQFGDVLQGARAVGAAHDVADRFDEGRERLGRGDGFGRLGRVAWHGVSMLYLRVRSRPGDVQAFGQFCQALVQRPQACAGRELCGCQQGDVDHSATLAVESFALDKG